jgi:hypothetical protein
MKWTAEEKAEAYRLRDTGVKLWQIAAHLNKRFGTDRHAHKIGNMFKRDRDGSLKNPVAVEMMKDASPRPTAAMIAERDRRAQERTDDPNQLILGDPVPSQSALRRR